MRAAAELENLARRPLLDDRPFVENDNPVPYSAREIHFMCNDGHGDAFFGKSFHDAQNFADRFGIERRSRFIEKHKVRLHRQCARDCNPLLLTPRKRGRILMCLVVQSDLVQHLDLLVPRLRA